MRFFELSDRLGFFSDIICPLNLKNLGMDVPRRLEKRWTK